MLKLLLIIFIVTFSYADRGLMRKIMQTELRTALVIGNNNYDSPRLLKLKNPVNDAMAMKSKLKILGFKVIYGENLSVRDMDKKLRKFSAELRKGGVGLFFFAGHGLELMGKNYLMGKDSKLFDKNDISYESLELNKVIDKMKNSGNRLNMVLLDACRNDPFSRSGGGGLAKVDKAKGMFIAYATSPGDVASDGSGKNGVFTEQILTYINEPNLPLGRLFKKIKKGVYDKTDQRQRPWTHDDIIGEFYFNLPQKKYTSKSKSLNSNAEISLWQMVKSNNTLVDYKYYMKRYPKGKFCVIAEYKILKLNKLKPQNILDTPKKLLLKMKLLIKEKNYKELEKLVVIRSNTKDIIKGIKHNLGGEGTDNGYSKAAMGILINNTYRFEKLSNDLLKALNKEILRNKRISIPNDDINVIKNILSTKPQNFLMIKATKSKSIVIVMKINGSYKLFFWKEMIRVANSLTNIDISSDKQILKLVKSSMIKIFKKDMSVFDVLVDGGRMLSQESINKNIKNKKDGFTRNFKFLNSMKQEDINKMLISEKGNVEDYKCKDKNKETVKCQKLSVRLENPYMKFKKSGWVKIFNINNKLYWEPFGW